MSVALLPDEPIRRLTVKEYNQLAGLGAFADERVELLDGVVYRISPPNAPHATVIVKLTRIFARHLADEIELRVQLPIETDRYSEPEPDFAVCKPRPDFGKAHPTTAGLVVEVSDTSRRRDLTLKPLLYARAGVEEYWVFDLPRRVVHQHLNPGAEGYELVRIVHPGETLRPVAFPELAIVIDELMPQP